MPDGARILQVMGMRNSNPQSLKSDYSSVHLPAFWLTLVGVLCHVANTLLWALLIRPINEQVETLSTPA